MLICAQGILREPILYLSLYFKTHRHQYYDLLQQIRDRGDWESWLGFFLEGISETSMQTVDTAQEILNMFDEYHHQIEGFGQKAESALRVHELLRKNLFLRSRMLPKRWEFPDR